MSETHFATDTHALYWHIQAHRRLSATAQAIFQQADTGQYRIYIPGIVLVEMVYLAEKGRLAIDQVNEILTRLDVPHSSYLVAQLDQQVARAIRQVDKGLIPELHDRIIVATALYLNIPLITGDVAIQQAAIVPVIW